MLVYRDGEPDYQRTSSARDLASQRREHSRGGSRDGRERMEKRVRSEPSMHEGGAREAGELVEEARPREKRSRRDRDARDGAAAILPPPPRRGSYTPTRLQAPEAGESRRGAATPPRLLNTLPAEIRQAALEAQQRDQARKAAAAKAAADEAAEVQSRIIVAHCCFSFQTCLEKPATRLGNWKFGCRYVEGTIDQKLLQRMLTAEVWFPG